MGTFSNTANVTAQSSDPGAIGAGALWSDTDAGLLYRRNDANTDWIPETYGSGTTTQRNNETVWIASIPYWDTTLDKWFFNSDAGAPNSVTWTEMGDNTSLQLTTQSDTLSADKSQGGTEADTGLSLTLPNKTGGRALVSAIFSAANDSASQECKFKLYHDGTIVDAQIIGDVKSVVHLSAVVPLDGTIVKVTIQSLGGTARIHFTTTDEIPKLETLEIYSE